MWALLALLVVTQAKNLLPSDADVAATIQTAIHAQINPKNLTVTVTRKSNLDEDLQHLEISMSGFKVTDMPFAALSVDDTKPVVAAKPAKKHPTTSLEKQPALLQPSTKDYRIVTAHVVCSDFYIKDLKVARLELNIAEGRIPRAGIGTNQAVLSAAREVTGTITLAEDDITTFLILLNTLPVQSPNVRITKEHVTINGNTPWVVLKVPITIPVAVTGNISARNGAVLYLDNPTLNIELMNMPKAVADKILKNLNPLVDLNAALILHVPITIASTSTEERKLILTGSLGYPKP